MIIKQDDIADNIIWFVATGVVTADDYEHTLVPAIEEKLKQHAKIRMLYQLDKNFENYTAGALWDDTEVGVKHFTAWDKIAVVTDSPWIRSTLNVFAFAVPGEMRIYTNDQLEEARDWVQL